MEHKARTEEQMISRGDATALTAEMRERLNGIEERIRVDLNCAYEKVCDIGRCLLRVKEEKLVPHGEWREWVQRVCGMSERQAQRWMQIAREVPEGSYLSRLEISKMREILALPEGEREEVAEMAVREDMSTLELKREIKRLKQEAEDARRETAEEAHVNERQRLELDSVRNTERAHRAELADVKEFANRQSERVRELERALKEAESATAEKGISAEAERIIEQLKRELKDAEEFGNIQAEKRQRAQDELMQLRKAVKDTGGAGISAEEMLTAAQAFLAKAGALPHMGAELSVMNTESRRPYTQTVGMIESWLAGAKAALNTVGGELV